MLKFFQRDLPGVGSVLYRGTLPPRAEEYAFLQATGVTAKVGKSSPDAHWSLTLAHPEWGEAELFAPKMVPPPPRKLLDLVPGLSGVEREAAKVVGTGVAVRVPGRKKNILRDRKNFLRWTRAIMADDAVVVADAGSMLFWSRAGLDDELAHDADLDISALFCAHAVSDQTGGRCAWLHTHGLAELGGFDFDILNPSEDVASGPGFDVVRAIAYAVAEGKVEPNTKEFVAARPGGNVRFVPAAEFDRRAPAAERAIRGDDGDHVRARAVVCDVTKGFLGFGAGVRASRFLSGPVSAGSLVNFSNAATELMAQRAQRTLGVLQRLMKEFAEFEFPVIAKIGYETDSGGGGREHLWFQVHGLARDGVDATLESSPHDITAMSKGVRGLHAIEKLTDWILITPMGWITPRQMSGARMVRERKDEVRRMMREGR